MANRALITGANGFLGKHVSAYLTQKNIEVIPLPHDLFYTYEENIEKFVKEAHADYIFHLASYGNLSEQQKYIDDIYSGTILATFNLLKATRKLSYKAFINISSSSVLLDYETMYSAGKKSQEALCRAFSNQYSLPIISVRPFSIYGPGEQETHLIPRLFRSCLYKEPMKFVGSPVHDYVYIDDIVAELYNIALNPTDWPTTEAMIGTGVKTSNDEVKLLIEAITGKKAKITDTVEAKPYDSSSWVASPKQGWVYFQSTPIAEGLQKVFKSYTLQ